MKKLMKIGLAAMVAGSVAISAQAELVAAWDFDNAADFSRNYTPFEFATAGAVASTNTGGLTLTQGELWVSRNHSSSITNDVVGEYIETAPVITEIDSITERVFRDGIDCTSGGQTMTLSGLAADQDYRIQFYGHLKAGLGTRNLTLDVGGLASGTLFGAAGAPGLPGDATDTSWAAFSEYIEFTGSGGNITLTISEQGAGNKTFSGFAIETIPEPATMGLVGLFGGGLLFVRRRLMV